MRRAFATVAGLAVAIPAAVLTMLLALVVVAAMRGGSSLPAALVGIVGALAWSDHPYRLVGLAVAAAAEAIAIVCCAPVICAALIGQVAGLVRPLGYAALTAVFTVLLPMAALGSALDALTSPSAFGTLLVTGGVAGLLYGAVGAPPRARTPISPVQNGRQSEVSRSSGQPIGRR